MSAKAIVRRPGEGKEVTLAGKPLVFLVTGQDTKHTSMFDWTLPAGFSTGTPRSSRAGRNLLRP